MTKNDSDLAGRTIGITAERKAREQIELITRRGGKVLHAPAIRLVALESDEQTASASSQLIQSPPNILIVTTGVGFRAWMKWADNIGIGDDLRSALTKCDIVTRGPKATGAVRAAGLKEIYSPASESSDELAQWLSAQSWGGSESGGDASTQGREPGVKGMRVAIQVHGSPTRWEPLTPVADLMREAGADVVEVPVYRWLFPVDPVEMNELISATTERRLDAVTFTSAPAAASFLEHADRSGKLGEVKAAFSGGVAAVCVGPITAGPLEHAGIAWSAPERMRLGAMIRHLSDVLKQRDEATELS